MFDLGVAPFADTVLRIAGDVAADGDATGVSDFRQFAATGEGSAHVEGLPAARRGVAQHAMSERREIAAVGGPVPALGYFCQTKS